QPGRYLPYRLQNQRRARGRAGCDTGVQLLASLAGGEQRGRNSDCLDSVALFPESLVTQNVVDEVAGAATTKPERDEEGSEEVLFRQVPLVPVQAHSLHGVSGGALGQVLADARADPHER